MRLRPHSADSTMLRLRPTGSSGGIAPVDYDPVVLLKPFGPRLAADALPSENSPMAAPGQPICIPAFAVVPSLSIPFHHLRPVRHYPHLWISARGLGLSGTSTHLTRQLSGTHYEPLRHPSAPSLSLAGVRLIIPDHALGFPVLRALSLCTCCRHYPGAADGRTCRSKITHPCQSSPIPLSGRPAHRPFRG